MVRDGVFSLSDQNFTNADILVAIESLCITNAIIRVCFLSLLYLHVCLFFIFLSYYFSFHIGMSLQYAYFIIIFLSFYRVLRVRIHIK